MWETRKAIIKVSDPEIKIEIIMFSTLQERQVLNEIKKIIATKVTISSQLDATLILC